MKKALFTFIVFLSLLGNDCLAQTIAERVDRISNKVGVSLPQEYKEKIRSNYKMSISNLCLLPELGDVMDIFFVDQMKIDRGINKSNQLCFLWEILARYLNQKDGLLYDPSSDTNVQRRADWKM